MKSDKLTLAFLFVVILSSILIWGHIVVKTTIGIDTALDIFNGKGKAQIESLGEFGASFGVIAALFAGIAVVLLWYNIRIQQKELTQLKMQMEHDRDIREYTWLIDAFCDARSRLEKNLSNSVVNLVQKEIYGSTGYRILKADKYILKESNRYLKNRARGDFNDPDDIESFINYYLNDNNAYKDIIQPFDTYFAAVKQIVLFINKSLIHRKNKYLNMFASVTNNSDLVFIHEQTILRKDSHMIELLQSTGLLGAHGSELYNEMSGGPRLERNAFGIMT